MRQGGRRRRRARACPSSPSRPSCAGAFDRDPGEAARRLRRRPVYLERFFTARPPRRGPGPRRRPRRRACTWGSGTARCSAAPEAGRGGALARRCPPSVRRGSLRRRGRAARARSATSAPAPSSSSSTPSAGAFSSWRSTPRIQVEHPVTEMVTGIDIVARAAARSRRASRCGFGQDDVALARPRDRVPDQRRGPGPRVRPVPRAPSTAVGRAGRRGHARRHRTASGGYDGHARTTTRCWPS